MDPLQHHVSGVFAQRDEAARALEALVELGMPRERLRLFDAQTVGPRPVEESASGDVLKNVLVHGAIGTAVGTGLGALGDIVLVAANVTLFVASPLIAPLAVMGWGASIGAVVGTVVGVEKKDGKFSTLVHDAVAGGHAVLLADTRTELETANARNVIQAAVGACRDVSAA